MLQSLGLFGNRLDFKTVASQLPK